MNKNSYEKVIFFKSSYGLKTGLTELRKGQKSKRNICLNVETFMYSL